MKKPVSKKTSRIAVIGAGKMATAITVSLVSKGVPASSILAYDVSAAAAKKQLRAELKAEGYHNIQMDAIEA